MAIIQGIGIGTVLYVLLAHINCVDFNQRVGIHIAIGVISFILLTIVPDLEALLHLEDITTFYQETYYYDVFTKMLEALRLGHDYCKGALIIKGLANYAQGVILFFHLFPLFIGVLIGCGLSSVRI